MRRLLRLGGERGMALPLALVVMAATGATLVSVMEYSSSSGRTANVANTRQSAEALAEAGIANALAVLNYWDDTTLQNNANDPTLLGCDSGGANCVPIVSTYGTGTATWYGVLNANTSTWTITSTGSLPNPTGGPALTKRLNATVAVAWNNSQPANASAWNYVFSTATPTTGCEVNITGKDVRISTPFYIRGDLCLSGENARFEEKDLTDPPSQPMEVMVGGKLVMSGSGSKVGKDASHPITSGVVVGGCASTITGATHTCSPANGDKYYVGATAAWEVLEFPTSDFAAYYASAMPGPNTDCVTATNPANLNGVVFDNDTVRNGTAPSFDLTPATDYQCKAYDANGILRGELSWDAGTSGHHDDGTLTVSGVIFFDGPVTSSSVHADYQGQATIYVNGGFSLTGEQAELCGNYNHKDCKFDHWDPNENMLLIVANATGNAINITGKKSNFQGGLFCNPDATINLTGDDVDIQGPVICGKFVFGKKAEFKSLPVITELPLGAPLNPNVHATPAKPVYGG